MHVVIHVVIYRKQTRIFTIIFIYTLYNIQLYTTRKLQFCMYAHTHSTA